MPRIAVIVMGLGASDTIDMGQPKGDPAYNDMFFVWTIGSQAYYIIDWDSRLNSHA